MKKFLFFLIFPFILAACAPFQDNTPESHSFFAMGTYMKITAYGKNSETVFLHAEKEIRRLDTLLSAENPDSEALPNHGTGQPAVLLTFPSRPSPNCGDSPMAPIMCRRKLSAGKHLVKQA